MSIYLFVFCNPQIIIMSIKTYPFLCAAPQVIFNEQLKLRNGMSRFTSCEKEGQPPAEPPLPRESTAASPQSTDTSDTLSAHQRPMQENANRLEIRALQRDLAAVRATCRELAKEQIVIQGQVYFLNIVCIHLCKKPQQSYTEVYEGFCSCGCWIGVWQVGRISKPVRGSSSSWSSGWKKLRLFSHNHKQEEASEKRETTNPPRWRNSIT